MENDAQIVNVDIIVLKTKLPGRNKIQVSLAMNFVFLEAPAVFT